MEERITGVRGEEETMRTLLMSFEAWIKPYLKPYFQTAQVQESKTQAKK